MAKILVIDDEPSVLDVIKRALAKEAHVVEASSSPEDGLALLASFNPDVVITDIRMGQLSGFDVLMQTRRFNPEINVILITAYASVETAVEALRGGAFDYLVKPFKINDLRIAVTRALSEKKLLVSRSEAFRHKEIVGTSEHMKKVKNLIQRVATTDSTVLIVGESGTGKELVARALHAYSPRVTYPFVSVNCAALPETLLESELFGFEKGSFTGALDTKIGLIEYAHEGTLFLDEIGDMSLAIQVKLLRVLQEREIKRVGGLKDIAVNVRVVAATSRDLETAVHQKTFREDLLYRLNVVPIVIPPLRERTEDIPLLVQHFLALHEEKTGKSFQMTAEAIERLCAYLWPGNIRELENTLERVLTLADEKTVTPAIIEQHWGKTVTPVVSTEEHTFSTQLKSETALFEKELLVKTLRETNGNQVRAAKKLNISRQNLQYYLKKYKIK